MPIIPNSFTNVFGGSPVQPSNVSYQSFDLPPYLVLNWPIVGLETQDVVSRFIDVNVTAASQTITMPIATQVSVGTDVLIRNLGEFEVQVLDFDGDEIAVIPPFGTGVTNALYFILIDNSTTAGEWGVIGFGATGSAVVASALAGNGLIALNNRLNTNIQVSTLISTNYTAVAADRAKYFIYTGGIGNFTLPQANAIGVGNGYMISVANRSVTGGQLTVAGQSGALIDGQSTLVLSLDQDCIFITDGTNWTTLGLGILTFFLVNVSNIIINDDTTIVIPIDDANKQIQIFTGNQDEDTLVTYPNISAIYYIINNTDTSDFVINVKVAGGAITTPIPNGERFIFYSDGSEMQPIPSSLANSAFPDGTAADPSITFRDAIADGWFLPSPHHIGLSIDGDQIIDYNANGIEFFIDGDATNPTLVWTNADGGFYWDNAFQYIKIAFEAVDAFAFSATNMLAPNGSAAVPAYSFGSDDLKGMYGSVLNELSFAIGGVKSAFINASGIALPIGNALAFFNPANTQNVSFGAGVMTAGSTAYTLPLTFPGTSGMSLISTTAGVMSWSPTVFNTNQILAPVGAVGTPSYSIIGHTNYGIYWDASNTGLGFSIAGVEKAFINSSGLQIVSGQILVPAGSPSAPTLAFTSNTGFSYDAGGPTIEVSIGGVEAFSFDAAGPSILNGGSLLFFNVGNTNRVALKAGAVATNTTYTLPLVFPTVSGQPLISTTTGTMSWAANAVFDTNGLTIAATKSLFLTNPGNTFTTSLTSGAVAGNTPYTLPTAYPSVNGQTLLSTTAGVMSWSPTSFTANQILGPNGAVGTPTYSYTSDPDSGIYSVASNRIGIACGGVQVVEVENDGTNNILSILGNNTTSGNLTLFNADNTQGIGLHVATALGSSYVLVLPSALPAPGDALRVDTVVGNVVTLLWAP